MSGKVSNTALYVVLAGVIVGIIMYLMPAPEGVNPAGWKVMALLLPVVCIWATEAIPVGVGSLMFLALVVAFQIVPSRTAFGGFTNHLPWLMFGAFAIGTAMSQTGLSKRMTYWLLSKVNSFWGLILGAYGANLALMAVPSSSARSGILAPILNAIMDTLGRPKESKLGRLLTYNYCVSTNAFAGHLFMTGGAGNATMLAIYGEVTGYTMSWMNWFTLMLVPACLFAVASIALSRIIVGAPEPELMAKVKDSTAAKEAFASCGKMTPDEWKVLFGFLLAIFLWVIGEHIKLSAGWASLLVAGLLFLPKIGVLPKKALNKINWDIVLLIGAVVGVYGIMDATGVVKLLTTVLIGPVLMPLGGNGSLIGIAIGSIIIGTIAHLFLPAPNNVAVIVTLLCGWAWTTMHFDIAVVMAFMAMLSLIGDKLVFLPYQMPPYYVFLALDLTDLPQFNKLMMIMYIPMCLVMVVMAFIVYFIASSTGIGLIPPG